MLSVLAAQMTASAQLRRPAVPEDIFALKDVGDIHISPDGKTAAYTVTTVNRVANSYVSHLRTVSLSGGAPVQLTTGNTRDTGPRWSPDGTKIAYESASNGDHALWVVDVKQRKPVRVAGWRQSNFFVSKAGETLAWSPNSQSIAFVAAEEHAEATGSDPRVITRVEYKTRTNFADNLHSHIFVVKLADRSVSQLTKGNYDEHSISWSPRGDEIAFLSNHEPDPDAQLNYDIFAVNSRTGEQRQITRTAGVELAPAWSPDGTAIAYTATTRPLTTIDSVSEDNHVFVISRDGEHTTELAEGLDRRCTSPAWSADGAYVYFLAGDHGKTLIYRAPRGGGTAQALAEARMQVGSYGVGSERIAFVRSDDEHPSEVYSAALDGSDPKALADINAAFARTIAVSQPQEFRFKSFDGAEIEGWLVRPIDFRAGQKYPMLLSIHGGPHGMFGYAFNLNNQIYAGHGYGVLYINPRGSSGYGQKFSDGCVSDWGGGDYKDLMAGVDAVIADNAWIDPDRLGVLGGSYGGYMTNWVISQTQRFKAAVAIASLSNLISFYSTSLYQDLVHVEFNGFPWDNYDLLWGRSPLKYIKNVTTPTLFIHGEQDNDVHITQAEEMYMGLKRRNIDAEFARYPREGHGLREPEHRLDELQRELAWFDHYLQGGPLPPRGK